VSVDEAVLTPTSPGGAPAAEPADVGGRRPAPAPARRRRRPRELTRDDLLIGVACAVSAVSLCWLTFARLTDGTGWFGFVVASYLTFLLLLGIATADRLGRLVAVDRVVTVLVVTGAAVLLIPLVWLIGFILLKGLPAISATFFTEDQTGITPDMASSSGGALHAIVGTLEQAGLALIVSLPLGVGAAIFLNETRSRLRRPVRIFVDAMSGLPSVVAGLFIYAVFILPFAGQGSSLFGFNGFMASLALSMVMLPTITRTVEVVLRLVPDGLREASLALGASRVRTVWTVVLPTAKSGVTTAVVLGVARVVGETAPLLWTAFGSTQMNWNPFSGPQESLPLFVLRGVRSQGANVIERSFAGALVLMALVLALFTIARWIGRPRGGRKRRLRTRLRGRRAPAAPAVLVPSLPSPDPGRANGATRD
jgi:phosphate transport system permease protein